MRHGATRRGGAVFFLGGLTVRRLIVVRTAEHGRMFVDNGGHTRAGNGLRHRELGAGARRPVLGLRDVLDDPPTEVTVNLRHGTPFGRAAAFKVVASAEGGAAALQRLQEYKPNVVLVDAALGRNRSQRLVESIKEAAPHARIIMMDVQPEEEDVIDFIKRGANGFISKDAALEDLVNTIRQVANGGDVVPSALTGTLLSHIAKQASILRNTPMMASVRMTKREQQITDLIAQGPGKKEKPHRRHN